MITVMEQRFYEGTMPEILRTLKAINENLAKMNQSLDALAAHADKQRDKEE
jgi:hypothetical protein